MQRILAGEQLMTVYQPIIQIAESAAELAVPLAQGKEPPADLASDTVDNGAKEVPSVLLEPVAVNKDNISEYLGEPDFPKKEEICAGKLASACEEAGI